ncbi:hypothetical protein LTR56_015465 [Elasticomyces elasticus]|nr:hypothetical protein LTR56_015465 [Elasticomyces elasticus]KAK5754892.1 hypothetical protein LTS12_015015 [Elasticomyces elasticus]
MMGTLRKQSLILSTSRAYTACPYYKSPPVLGSLTLGGYDATHSRPNNVSFAFYLEFSRDLQVNLQSITYDTVGSSPLLVISIESSSFIHHRDLAADQYWDSTAQFHIIDNNVHDALLAQNPTQAGPAAQGPSTSFCLYAAFDLNVMQPLVGSTSRYFPLKQTHDYTQYILGRTFLQQADMIADYDRQKFPFSQGAFPTPSVSQNINALNLPISSRGNGGQEGRKSEAIAGIVNGIVVVLAAAICCHVAGKTAEKMTSNRESTGPVFNG